MNSPKSDDELIESARLGEQWAFSELFDRYSNYVYTLAIRFSQDSLSAQEITQDSFLKAFKNILQFRSDSKFSTWLYSIVTNTAINYLKKHQRHNLISVADEKILDYLSEITPVDENSQSLSEKLVSALKQLDDEDQIIITLFYLHEEALIDIAKILNISEAAAKVRLFRARKRLQKIFS